MTLGKRMIEEMFLVYFEIIPIVEMDDVELLKATSMVSNAKFSFSFISSKKQKLNGVTKGFDDKSRLQVFHNKTFEKGNHSIETKLHDLPKGNYFLEISDQNGEILVRHVLVNVRDDFFD